MKPITLSEKLAESNAKIAAALLKLKHQTQQDKDHSELNERGYVFLNPKTIRK